LSYTIDVYRGEIQPEKNLSTYLLYIAFFPQLVAGPIVPAKILLPQLEYFLVNERLGLKGVYLISIGLVKKLLIADRLAMLVDTFYANPADYSWAAALISVFAYSIQIFCDFSGYTDIARGSALLFGITLPENFQAPYLSLSFSEFWRRWHITLSTWLKNYLYISLGGNRKGKFRTSVNLLLTMLLGGLWHGASWNFLTWGLLHGLLLVLEKSFSTSYFLSNPVISTVGKFKRLAFLTIFLRWMMVFLFVTLLWIPFRSPNFETTLIVLKKIFIYSGGLNFPKSLENEFFLIISIILVAHFFYLKGFDGEIYILKFPKWILVFLFVILLHMV
ncbi:MAG: MBOAT family protein, partial [Leptospiraceae bacterium]|nr:MBOAT family protein [Leptospiraceae bacterium]